MLEEEEIESVIELNNVRVHYVKRGHGKHPLLLLPGALGTARTDFAPQLDGLDKSLFTLVCWEPPGHGKSRPHVRDRDYLEMQRKDSQLADKLMKSLGHETYSLLGFSDGGRTALMMMVINPHPITRAVICGCSSFVTPKEKQFMRVMRDVNQWSESNKSRLVSIYGNDLQTIWANFVDAYIGVDGDIFTDKQLASIRCPVLILHGEKDPIVASHHSDHLRDNIKGSRLYKFPGGPHYVQQVHAKKFNQFVTDFLLES